MTSKTVFEFSSYKEFMAYMLTAERRRGQLTRAAEALGCQRSYLSRIISHAVHITPDHAYELSCFWQLSSLHQDYFLTQVDYERAANRTYKKHLLAKMDRYLEEHQKISLRTDRAQFEFSSLQSHYFSTWVHSAVHFLTSVPQYQEPLAIATKLGLPTILVEQSLASLEAQGFVELSGGKWKYSSGEFHLPKDSPLLLMHHQNWRSKAILDAQAPALGGTHYTAVQTISRDDFGRLKEITLNFISDASKLAGPSRPEEPFVLTLDLFQL